MVPEGAAGWPPAAESLPAPPAPLPGRLPLWHPSPGHAEARGHPRESHSRPQGCQPKGAAVFNEPLGPEARPGNVRVSRSCQFRPAEGPTLGTRRPTLRHPLLEAVSMSLHAHWTWGWGGARQGIPSMEGRGVTRLRGPILCPTVQHRHQNPELVWASPSTVHPPGSSYSPASSPAALPLQPDQTAGPLQSMGQNRTHSAPRRLRGCPTHACVQCLSQSLQQQSTSSRDALFPP